MFLFVVHQCRYKELSLDYFDTWENLQTKDFSQFWIYEKHLFLWFLHWFLDVYSQGTSEIIYLLYIIYIYTSSGVQIWQTYDSQKSDFWQILHVSPSTPPTFNTQLENCWYRWIYMHICIVNIFLGTSVLTIHSLNAK